MPQERRRSVVYRSFVTCEDPRGVIEGKTIRISKTDPTKLGSNDKQLENSKEKEKEKMPCSKPPSSYELVEVKNGAQKLNQAIDSWSNGGHFKSQPKDIAKDLLKGALDLQESLMMLGKLQEASCITKLKKKQEKSSEVLVSKIKSDRFKSFQDYDMGFEKQRNSENGSSKDCYSELRDVIRDGLSKQNLLPHKSFQESAFADSKELAGKRRLQLSPDMASTSSSRSSSMVYSTHEFTSSDSFSSRATEEKSKGSNLIAKLMGLDEFPSKPLPSTPRNQLRPTYDVDLPNGKNPQFFVEKVDREHMTLDEIIEMMQTKGHLRSNKREIKQKRFEDDVPPIVLMKPQRIKANANVNTNSIRKLHQEKAKAEEKVMKSREKSGSNKQKASVPGVIKPERKQEMEKKIDKIQKIAPQVKRKQVENVKLTNSVSKNVSLKQVKPQRNTSPSLITKRVSSSSKSSNQKKNAKIEKMVNEVNKPSPTIIHEVLKIDSPNEHEIEDSQITSNNVEETGVSDVKQPKAEILKSISTIQDSEILENVSSIQDSGILETVIQDSEILENVCSIQDSGILETVIQDSGILETVSNIQDSGILKTISSFQNCGTTNSGVFQDCINEFLEHEKRRKNQWLTTSMLTLTDCGSEDELMREVVKGVESLRNYSKFSNECSNGDMVHGYLERDLCLNKMGGTWSSGWKDGCTLDEVEEVVLDLEKIVLSKLIDDVLMELVP